MFLSPFFYPMPHTLSHKTVNGWSCGWNHQTSMDFTSIPSARERILGRVHDITKHSSQEPVFHTEWSEVGENTFLIKVSCANIGYLIKGKFRKEHVLNFYERNSQDEAYIYRDVQFDVFSYHNDSYTQIPRDKLPKVILEELKKNDYLMLANLPSKKTLH